MAAHPQKGQQFLLLLYSTNADIGNSVNNLNDILKIQAESNPITIHHEIEIPEHIKRNSVIISVDKSYFYNQSGRKINHNGAFYFIIALSQPHKFIHFYNYFMNEYLPEHYINETLDLSGLINSPLPIELREERNPFNFNYPPFCQTLSFVCYLFSNRNHRITSLMLIGNNLCNPQSTNKPLTGFTNMMECLPLYFPQLSKLYLADNGISLIDENIYQQTLQKFQKMAFKKFNYNRIEYILDEQILFVSRETDLKQDFILSQISGHNLNNTLDILQFLRENEDNFPREAYLIPEAYDLHHFHQK